MTSAGEDERETGGDEILAAEYVLGAMQAEERQVVGRRIEADPDFARLIEHWEKQLAPLASNYEPVEPPVAIKEALDRRLFSDTGRRTSRAAGIWRSLPFWRGLAAAALVALAVISAIPVVFPPAGGPAVQLAASLAAEGSEVRYLAAYDPIRNRVGLSHLAGVREPGRDFELWLIESGRPPISLGVIPEGETVHLPLASREKFRPGAVLAISLEPPGGSRTGQPTGAVIAQGEIRSL